MNLVEDFVHWAENNPVTLDDCEPLPSTWGGRNVGTGGWNKGISEENYKAYEPEKYSHPTTPWNKGKSGYKNNYKKRVYLTDLQKKFIKDNPQIKPSIICKMFDTNRSTVRKYRD